MLQLPTMRPAKDSNGCSNSHGCQPPTLIHFASLDVLLHCVSLWGAAPATQLCFPAATLAVVTWGATSNLQVQSREAQESSRGLSEEGFLSANSSDNPPADPARRRKKGWSSGRGDRRLRILCIFFFGGLELAQIRAQSAIFE